MKAEKVKSKKEIRQFHTIASIVYKGNPNYRATEASIEKLLIHGPTSFHKHAFVIPYLIYRDETPVGRFALIHDSNLEEYVQVAFFEAFSGLEGVAELIIDTARSTFPECKKIVFGLNGHLNYGAGFLISDFDRPPLFGLPYTQAYYQHYFKDLTPRKMHSFRFALDQYVEWNDQYNGLFEMQGLVVRKMSKKNLKRDSSIYTQLNNSAFTSHPYWANRLPEEDLELFNPFRFLMDEDNLIIAEVDGQPVGFVLWYPDFNELVKSGRDLNVIDVLRYKAGFRFKTFRFTEIGILPEYQRTPVGLAMLRVVLDSVKKKGFKYCEAGFIFEENKASILLANRIIERSFGIKPKPDRSYAVYETSL